MYANQNNCIFIRTFWVIFFHLKKAKQNKAQKNNQQISVLGPVYHGELIQFFFFSPTAQADIVNTDTASAAQYNIFLTNFHAAQCCFSLVYCLQQFQYIFLLQTLAVVSHTVLLLPQVLCVH